MNEFRERLLQLYLEHGVDGVLADPSLVERAMERPMRELQTERAFQEADTLLKLLGLHVRHGITAMRTDASLIEKAFQLPQSELAKSSLYQDANTLVSETAKFVESRAAQLNQPDVRLRLSECLKVALNRATFWRGSRLLQEAKFGVLRDYFILKFGQEWTPAQRQHFDVLIEFIQLWKIYFLSYTNRQPRAINKRFEQVISFYVDPDKIGKRDAGKDNILADALLNRLNSLNLTGGFFDKVEIQPGYLLSPTVQAAAGSSFYLLQIVQPETFMVEPPPNHCYEEYELFEGFGEQILAQWQRYREIFRKRFCALLTHDRLEIVVPPMMPYEYELWKHRIFVEARFEVLPTDPAEFNELARKVAAAVCNLQNELIEAVP